ncbi:hypothetical protein, partial [Faecalibacterium prausnitzii]|uniref:hypothetical protein n=1 Tax=Faecalibacterium prausnitzii TaxID=853 RepID=UPI00210EB56D
PIVVETIGYSVVEEIGFKLEGSYSGAIEGPGNEFTAYFEYKEEALTSALNLYSDSTTVPNLDKDAHRVTKIVLEK